MRVTKIKIVPFLPLSLLHLTLHQRRYVVWNFNFTMFVSFRPTKTWILQQRQILLSHFFLINTGIISPLLMTPFTSASPNFGLSVKLTSHFYINKDYLRSSLTFYDFNIYLKFCLHLITGDFISTANSSVKSNDCERTLIIMFVKYL
jgi:hypothetical protein